MLDEELFNKSKALDVDVVQNWKRTLEKFKSARGKTDDKNTTLERSCAHVA